MKLSQTASGVYPNVSLYGLRTATDKHTVSQGGRSARRDVTQFVQNAKLQCQQSGGDFTS